MIIKIKFVIIQIFKIKLYSNNIIKIHSGLKLIKQIRVKIKYHLLKYRHLIKILSIDIDK